MNNTRRKKGGKEERNKRRKIVRKMISKKERKKGREERGKERKERKEVRKEVEQYHRRPARSAWHMTQRRHVRQPAPTSGHVDYTRRGEAHMEARLLISCSYLLYFN